MPLTEHAEVWLVLDNVPLPCLKAFFPLNRPMPLCFYSLLSVYIYVYMYVYQYIHKTHTCYVNTHSVTVFC